MRERRRRADPDSDRSLRGLVSTRDTQVPAELAMRAREVDLPSAAELAEVEAGIVLVRRHYQPPAPLSAAGRRSGPRPQPRTGPGAQPAGSSGSAGSAS